MKKVFCAGLVVCDVPLRPVPDTAFKQEHVWIDLPEPSVGGDAANVAITLRRLGAPAALAGLLGRDANGDFVEGRLRELGIDVSGIRRHPSLGTIVSYILVEPGGERHFLVYNELNKALKYEDIAPELMAGADLVFFGGVMAMPGMDEGGTAALFKRAHELGKITAADFKGGSGHDGAYWRETLGPMLRETDLLLPSFREAALLTGAEELGEIRRRLSGYGLKVLVVKLGKEGCYVTDFRDEWRVPAFGEFEPLDTTGAGDAFAGGFIFGYLAGWSLVSAAAFANAVAGFNITKVGATGGIPDFETVYRYVTEHSGGPGDFPYCR